jgi:hypothetical protein
MSEAVIRWRPHDCSRTLRRAAARARLGLERGGEFVARISVSAIRDPMERTPDVARSSGVLLPAIAPPLRNHSGLAECLLSLVELPRARGFE